MSAGTGNAQTADVREKWRESVLDHDDPRLVSARQYSDPFEYAQVNARSRGPRGEVVRKQRAELIAAPYQGITTDGSVQDGLFSIADEGFDPAPVVAAAESFLTKLSDEQRAEVNHPLDSPAWREWFNGGAPINHHGLWLAWTSQEVRDGAVEIMRASLSEEGCEKTWKCRSSNLFLGELYDVKDHLSEWGYQFLLFGEPSETEPWGWSFYGHHMVVNSLIFGHQIHIGPTFLAAEPTIVERGPDERFTMFDAEMHAGLAMIRSLSPEVRARVITYEQLNDPAMPPGRVAPLDERHLGGSFWDNRVIPYEGVCAAEFSEHQQQLLLDLVESFIDYLPAGPRAARMAQVKAHLDDTWFSWIGGYGDDDPFYYRVQSPVIMVEYDNHFGSFMANKEPAKFHVHTIVRTPNGNDYGKALLRQRG